MFEHCGPQHLLKSKHSSVKRWKDNYTKLMFSLYYIVFKLIIELRLMSKSELDIFTLFYISPLLL